MMAAPRDKDAEEPAAESPRPPPKRTNRPTMTYRIVLEGEYLRAELANCESVAEMGDFLRALARNSARRAAILITVRASKPLFHVERDGLIEFMRQIARAPQHRIALLADTPDLQASHEYLELIARQRGVRVRSFRNESEALDWFKDRRANGERRREDGPRPAIERRAVADRRQGGRKA